MFLRKWCSLQVVQWDCKHNSPSMRTDSCRLRGNVSVDQDWLNIEQDHEYLLGFGRIKIGLIYHVLAGTALLVSVLPSPQPHQWRPRLCVKCSLKSWLNNVDKIYQADVLRNCKPMLLCTDSQVQLMAGVPNAGPSSSSSSSSSTGKFGGLCYASWASAGADSYDSTASDQSIALAARTTASLTTLSPTRFLP